MVLMYFFKKRIIGLIKKTNAENTEIYRPVVPVFFACSGNESTI
jgi:hypothetical protein